MNLTKAEAMKAVIDGISIQHCTDDKTWTDSFAGQNYTLITKLRGIDGVVFPYVFRLKPTPKTIRIDVLCMNGSTKQSMLLCGVVRMK